ncbi:MAG TPA: cytochrome c maturation protein CcmE [Ktedonobacteraceae bacterium]|nr:cytochrome c maturation protein CcmE [Ktedonobacteraceae bacterium]
MQPALTVPKDEPKPLKPRNQRKRLPLSFLLAGIAILGAIVYLVYANTQANAVYYMTVPELKQCTTCVTQSVRVAGVVQSGTIVRDDAHQTISFTIADSNSTLQVVYSGVVPDIFRPGIQVVVEGHYTGKGPFQAQTLLAKCPSKFQSATPASTQ